MLRNIKLALVSILVGLSGLWLLASMPFPETPGVIAIRNLLVQYLGVIGIGVMSVAMVLALRPVWSEPWLGGLDKSYRLHKWLGISGLVAAVFHWLFVNAPKWAVGLGLIASPDRRRASADDVGAASIESFLRTLRGTAELIGEWAFYAVVLLIALALIRRFPYRLFAKTHTLIAVAYLALVFHSVVLLDYASWSKPLGWVMVLLLIAGSVSAVLVPTRQVGKRRQVQAWVESTHYFPEMKVLQTTLRINDGWKGHKSGQFAFVSFDPKEGQHPFTIASAWNASAPSITFITKALGDYTALIPEQVKVGQKATVEGPYGCFTFDDEADRQIWIGGGIGITPFIARMKQLAGSPAHQRIDLFHSATELAPDALAKLTEDAAAAQVNLHVLIDSRDGYLTGDKLRATVPDWKTASVWFCGPAGFGTALKRDLVANGLSRSGFHQELFNMR